MTTSTDTFPLGTSEAIVIDGPNGVSGAPRAGFPHAGPQLALSVVALVVAVLVLRRAKQKVVLAALLGLAALPGLWCVLVERADAPSRRGELASSVTTTLGVLAPYTGWPSAPASVTYEEDDVLFPLLRYAMPSRPPGGVVKLSVRGSALSVRCAQLADTIDCGGAR